MMRKIGILVVAAMVAWIGLTAQGLSVTSFRPLPNDLTANMAGTSEKDQNGEVAALIKVVTTQTGFSFEGGAAGIVKTKQEVGEVWVYVPHGIKKITIKHPQLGVLRDYFFPCAIEKATTYEMALASGEVHTTVTQDLGVSYLVLSVMPKTASVYIDGELQENDGSGEIVKSLAYGEHQYRVEAGNCLPEAGVVQIGRDKVKVNVSLKSSLAKLSISATTPGTEIYISEMLKGKDSWNGSLGSGVYVIEGRKSGYRSQKISVTLAKQEEKSITLPALDPMYGMLNVNYKPVGTEVWIDGKLLGSTPDVFKNILVGSHKVELKKSGCLPYSEDIIIAEGETKDLVGTLSNNLYPDFKGKIPADGTAAKSNYDRAIIGDALAQCSLGYWYDTSEKDMASAVYWYGKAAVQGNAKAQFNLGMCYEFGKGVGMDYAEAVKWYRKAAEQGLAAAQFNLGVCYEYARGISKDYTEAVKWYRKATEQGDSDAQCNLGGCYFNGNGVTQDYWEAYRLFLKAAEKGSKKAYSWLGYCSFNGKGVSQDYAEAAKWYRKAAEEGDAYSQNNLGACYEDGKGVVKNINEAVKWYRKAAEQGHEKAKNNLKRLGY